MVYINEDDKMMTLNKRLKIVQSPGIIFNYAYYKDDGESYLFYYNGGYIGFVDKNKIDEIII
jgi:hypothetical protein